MDLTRASRSLLLAAEPAWFSVHSPRARRIHRSVRDWLAESGSLTARLQALAGPIRVQVLYQDWGRAFLSEAAELQMRRSRRVWIREVALEAAGRQLLLARTVAPTATVTGWGKRFTCLGTRPLGELLFSLPGVKRVNIAWSCLNPTCWLAFPGPRPRWGRRTLYLTGPDLPLLVSEFFLPAVFALEAGDGVA